jgi:hypothetical protein
MKTSEKERGYNISEKHLARSYVKFRIFPLTTGAGAGSLFMVVRCIAAISGISVLLYTEF